MRSSGACSAHPAQLQLPLRPAWHHSLQAPSPSAGSLPISLMLETLSALLGILRSSPRARVKLKPPRHPSCSSPQPPPSRTPAPSQKPLPGHFLRWHPLLQGRGYHRCCLSPGVIPVIPPAASCAGLGDTVPQHPIFPGGAAEAAERTAVTRYCPDLGLAY